MTTIGSFDEDPDRHIEESASWLLPERLAVIREPGFLTVAQVAALVVSDRFRRGLVEPSQLERALADFVGLVHIDIADGMLVARSPESMLPWSQYKKMAEAGIYTEITEIPMPDMGWLVAIDDAERWYEAKGFAMDFTSLRVDMEGIAARSLLCDSHSGDTEDAAPKQRSQAQDLAILSALRLKGYDPSSLPPYKQGKPGVKAEIRAALGSNGLWAGTRVFDKAWERLLSNKEIDYKKG